MESITIEEYVCRCRARREEVKRDKGWTIEDAIFELAMEKLRDIYPDCFEEDEHDPKVDVDNLIVNGDKGLRSEFSEDGVLADKFAEYVGPKDEDEDDDAYEERVEEGWQKFISQDCLAGDDKAYIRSW